MELYKCPLCNEGSSGEDWDQKGFERWPGSTVSITNEDERSAATHCCPKCSKEIYGRKFEIEEIKIITNEQAKALLKRM